MGVGTRMHLSPTGRGVKEEGEVRTVLGKSFPPGVRKSFPLNINGGGFGGAPGFLYMQPPVFY